MGQLRILLFKEYPYLYKGTLEEELPYLDTYFSSSKSRVVCVFDSSKLVGFCTAIPLVEMPGHSEPLKKEGFAPENFLYIGEVLLLKDYRGQGFLDKFMKLQEEHAVHQGYSFTTFVTICRAEDHPERPQEYKDLKKSWERLGYQPLPSIKIEVPWRQVDTGVQEINTLIFGRKRCFKMNSTFTPTDVLTFHKEATSYWDTVGPLPKIVKTLSLQQNF